MGKKGSLVTTRYIFIIYDKIYIFLLCNYKFMAGDPDTAVTHRFVVYHLSAAAAVLLSLPRAAAAFLQKWTNWPERERDFSQRESIVGFECESIGI
jgi:hypothetical protein